MYSTELPSKKSSSNVVSVMMRCTAADPSLNLSWVAHRGQLQTSVWENTVLYLFTESWKNKNLIKNLNSLISYWTPKI